MLFKNIKEIFNSNSSQNLQSLILNDPFLVDIRTPQEYADGNVKGSVNIPLDILLTQLASFKNKENIIVFCRSGNRSGQAKTILNQNNIMNVSNGGTWQNVNQFVNS